jgi:hypothetical protein
MSRDEDTWPLPAEVPAWWRDRPLTAEQLEQMREEYEQAQIEDAKSAAAFEANQQEYRK